MFYLQLPQTLYEYGVTCIWHYGCDLLIQVACLQLTMACCSYSENKQTHDHVRAVIVIAIGRKHVGGMI